MPRTLIAAAGRHLLSVLATEGRVPYSRFYNDKPGTDTTLAAGSAAFLPDADEGDREHLVEEGHLHLEWAAYQLENYLAVNVAPLPAKLIDDSEDFEISITDRGREVAGGKLQFNFHSLNSGFYGAHASQWLIDMAWHNSDVEEWWDFGLVRELGYRDGEVRVTDDSGNAYPPGSRPYDWAFEVALWHHVRSGHLVLKLESDNQRDDWQTFLTQFSHLFRHDQFPASCRNVKYALAEHMRPKEPDNLREEPPHYTKVGWFGRE